MTAGAEFLFDVIATANERTSVILTTNLGFEHWTEVLGDERLTGTAFDRLTYRCTIIETAGESYHLLDAKRRLKAGSLHSSDFLTSRDHRRRLHNHQHIATLFPAFYSGVKL